MNSLYSSICNHPRLKRIDKDFVRCLNCGESMISQKTYSTNKTSADFVKENKSFARNFNRNFTNEIEQIDEECDIPHIEYYADAHRVNKIIIDKRVVFNSDPPKYKVSVNGGDYYMTKGDFDNLISTVRAIRLDAATFKR